MSRCRLGISRAVALVVATVLGIVLLLVSGKPKATQYRQKTSRLGVRGETSVFNSLPLRAIVAGHSVVSPEGIHSTLENSDTVVGLDYLFRINWNCSTKACTQFLTEKDEPHFKYCIKKTWNVELKEHTEPDNTTCVFINGSSRHPMALASYPGSGNTWVRGLLQRTTGLCTGAIYCDITLRKNGFPGESIRSGAAFLVKTHQTNPRWEFVQYSRSDPFLYFKRLQDVPVFAGGVFIIRNPFHAMVAEYKRIMWEDKPDNHVRSLGIKYFGNNSKWNLFVVQESTTWRDTVLGWLGPGIRPVLLIRYEDFQLNPKSELERILHFLQVPYHREQLELVVKEGFEEYKRPKPQNKLKYYTQAQKKLVRNSVKAVQAKLNLDLSSYWDP